MRFLTLILIALLHIGTASTAEKNWEKTKQTVLKNLSKIDGWCPPEKAIGMMELIYETQPEICVEIGVFGGSSIFPTATALKYIGKGIVHAIDPWSNQECLEGYDPNDPNYLWWKSVNLEQILDSFKVMLKRFKLDTYCNVMRMTSEQAISHFADESIDIIHIDGNHSEDSALLDAQLFLPKLKPGAYVWFDDANWVSTHKAIAYLLEYCDLDSSIPDFSPFLLMKKR